MEWHGYDTAPLKTLRIKELEKEVRALKRRHEYVVRTLIKKLIPEEEWDEWLAEYLGDMED